MNHVIVSQLQNIRVSPLLSLSLSSLPATVCLIAALRLTLLTPTLLFDSLCVSLLVLLPSLPLLFSFFFNFFYFFTLSDIPTSLRRPSIHLYSLFLSSESCRHPRFGTRTTFCRLPAGPAAIILRIDLCCIDER